MNKTGQMVGVGALVMLAITIIVGAILLQGSAQNIHATVNQVSVANVSLGAKVVNGTAQYLCDYTSISGVEIYNETGDVVIEAANYTVTNNVVYNGAECVKIVPDTDAETKSIWKVSGTAQLQGYDDDSGGRTMASLIIIMMALALAVIVVTYVARQTQGITG